MVFKFCSLFWMSLVFIVTEGVAVVLVNAEVEALSE